MRIGIVCYPTIGGSGVIATRLGALLAQRGHEVHFITYEPPFALDLGDSGIFFHQVPVSQYDLFKYPDYALTLAVKLAQVTRDHHLDVLHVHYAIPHATSAYLAQKLLGNDSPKIVTTLHGTDITLIGRDPSFFDIVKLSIEQSDVVTAVSNHLREETVHHFGIQKEIQVIPNFVLPPELSSPPSWIPQGKKVLIHVSNFRPVKRVEDVIRIYAAVQHEHPSILLLVGDGPELSASRRLASELGVEEGVHWLGARHAINDLLASSHLFLLPSEEESFGLAALEAMAHGVPVLASKVGGLPEVISDGEHGYLCQPEEMSARACQLLDDEELRQRMGTSAKQHALSRFGATGPVSAYESLYSKRVQSS